MENTKKLVSVIVPCYNAENVIDRCISSLVRQSIGLENLEIVLVDDASTDHTYEKLQEWENRYPESILLIHCEENGRTGAARNIGISYASADYIGFVDNDDYVDETMYEKMYRAITEQDCDVVGVLYDRVRGDGTGLDFPMPKGKKEVRVRLTEDGVREPEEAAPLPGEIWSKLYRKDLIVEHEVWFPEKLCYPENYWAPLLRYYMKSYYLIDEVLYFYVMNEESVILTADHAGTKDRLTVQTLLLEELQRRGLDRNHPEQIEYDFLRLYYVNSLHLFLRHYTELPYELFDEMKREVLRRYPEYYKNPLVKKACNQERFVLYLLLTLELRMTPEIWDALKEKYQCDIADVSVLEAAERDPMVQGTVETETHQVIHKEYQLLAEMRQSLTNWCIRLQEAGRLEYDIWREIRKAVMQMLRECQTVNEMIRMTDGSCWKTFEQETVDRYLERIEQEIVCGDEMDALQELCLLVVYLELPENLYRYAWERIDWTPPQFFPALEFCYMHPKEKDLLEHARQMIFNGRSPLFAFPYEKSYYPMSYGFDAEANMYFYVQNGIKLYLPHHKYPDQASMEHYVLGLLIEQDERSPHRYFNERMEVPEGTVVLDAGVAEGNFTASVIDRAKKVYLVECDPEWVKALRLSFRDYEDKIVIIEKYLSDFNDDTHITVDEIMKGKPLDYMKMDIEGEEPKALCGAVKTIQASEHLKCNICVYHNLGDDEKVCGILSEQGMDIEHTEGYVFFCFDQEHPNYPRKGLVQAVK